MIKYECKICGTTSGHETFKCREMMFGTREEFIYFLCSRCGCLQISEVPVDINRHYPSKYYSYVNLSTCSISPVKGFLKKARLRYSLTQKGILGLMLVKFFGKPVLPEWVWAAQLRPDDRILDVGCGVGELLVALREEGFKKLHGIDPFISNDIQYSNGVIIRKKDIFSVSEEYDVVMLHHSFEHMPDPLEVLKAVRLLLSKVGSVIIRIPVVSSYAWRYYKTNWVQLDAPRHLFLHSLQSMNMLSKKSGLVLNRVEFDSNANQFWGSEQIIRDIPYADCKSYRVNPENSIFRAEEIEEYRQVAARLNKEEDGDQAVFYLSNSEA